MKLVIDTSVAVKCMVLEERRELALPLLENRWERLAPDFILLEAANVFSRKQRDSQMDAGQIKQALGTLASGLIRLERSEALLSLVLDLSLRFRHAVYDCLFLALAENENGLLVTDDETFVRKATNGGLGNRVASLRMFAG